MSSKRNAAHLFVRVITVTLLLWIFALPATAQTNKADIVGTITDSNGPTVQGATITITKIDTNTTRSVTSGDSGEYNAPSLDIGTYKITVTKQGYQTVTQENVVLQTNDRLRIDLTLPPGSVSGEVTITAAPPLVETESSDRGSVISGREVTELPLSGRNFTELATLTPGVIRANTVGLGGGPEARSFNNGDPRAGSGGPGSSNPNGSSESSRFNRSGGAAISANGQRGVPVDDADLDSVVAKKENAGVPHPLDGPITDCDVEPRRSSGDSVARSSPRARVDPAGTSAAIAIISVFWFLAMRFPDNW